MNFTLVGTDPRFFYLKKRLESDGHTVTAENGRIIAPPAMRTGIPYYTDEIYALENAALTAEGAAELLMRRLPGALARTPILIAGYGRIGSRLAALLDGLGARITVAARNPVQRAAARSRGHNSVDITHIVPAFEALINTVPAPVLEGDYGGALCLDLASAPGGWKDDTPVLKAPGLPGLYAPKAAAGIMADAIYRVLEVKA